MSRCLPHLFTLAVPLILSGCAETPERPAPEKRTPQTAADSDTPQPTPDQPAAEGKPADQTSDRPSPKKRSIEISLKSQSFIYSEDGEQVREGPISSGAAGHPTPTGHFRVLSKDENKVSSRYTNQLGMQAWMPYSIQFHGNYFLHEGWLPGYPDSHGCVRVGEPDARFLFERLQIGDAVTLSN